MFRFWRNIHSILPQYWQAQGDPYALWTDRTLGASQHQDYDPCGCLRKRFCTYIESNREDRWGSYCEVFDETSMTFDSFLNRSRCFNFKLYAPLPDGETNQWLAEEICCLISRTWGQWGCPHWPIPPAPMNECHTSPYAFIDKSRLTAAEESLRHV